MDITLTWLQFDNLNRREIVHGEPFSLWRENTDKWCFVAIVARRVKPRVNTNLVNVAVGPAAYPLDELVLVLGIPTAYVTGQCICVHRSHRERQRRSERKRGKERGEREKKAGHPGLCAVDPSLASANRCACTCSRVRAAQREHLACRDVTPSVETSPLFTTAEPLVSARALASKSSNCC